MSFDIKVKTSFGTYKCYFYNTDAESMGELHSQYKDGLAGNFHLAVTKVVRNEDVDTDSAFAVSKYADVRSGRAYAMTPSKTLSEIHIKDMGEMDDLIIEIKALAMESSHVGKKRAASDEVSAFNTATIQACMNRVTKYAALLHLMQDAGKRAFAYRKHGKEPASWPVNITTFFPETENIKTI